MNNKIYLSVRFTVQLVVSIALVSILTGCGPKQHATAAYKAYDGPEKTPKELTSILMFNKAETGDYVDWVVIEATRINHDKYGEITIKPGTYLIEWERDFQVSPMIKASGSEVRKWSTTVTLEAGHNYTIHADRTVGHGYIIYSWITDDTQNKTIWGREFVPGPYYFLRK
ncbi:MAG: hypothetical protein OEM01_03165 [Desulfobulbaceae bacterium]|nr:hypothetical protein [Desulfobulbaceae bacterium]